MTHPVKDTSSVPVRDDPSRPVASWSSCCPPPAPPEVAMPPPRRAELNDVESGRQDAAVLAENELKQIQPDRLYLVAQEPPVRMLAEVAVRKDAVAQMVEAPVTGTSCIGKAALVAQDRFQ